jgi:hypothetical protein
MNTVIHYHDALWIAFVFSGRLFGRIHMMKHGQAAELPACPFMVGQDSDGNWVGQNQSRTRGGLFGDRIDVLRFVRSENANRTQAYIAVNGIFRHGENNERAVATTCSRYATRSHGRLIYLHQIAVHESFWRGALSSHNQLISKLPINRESLCRSGRTLFFT